MKLYNTLTRELEEVTGADGVIRMYVCGVTPYDTAHLGHAFTYVCFDTLERYLNNTGFDTINVQNVTDIDDDILRAAEERGIPWDELARRETEKYLADMRALNVLPPDHFPHATQEIDKMIEMVSTLLEKGVAYEVDGSAYYDIHADEEFGRLVDWDYDKMLEIANERGNFPDDENKRDPLDFVLWQAAKPGEPSWDSPWGQGRPGWHIECSAMSMRYLGETVDIHCGGADLIFPHHECEIAQSEGYSGMAPFVKTWFHIAMVRYEGEKMSKSLGNMIFIRDLLEDWMGDEIRLYLLVHKYREPWSADQAQQELTQSRQMVARWTGVLGLSGGAGDEFDPAPFVRAFRTAMDNDFDTGQAIEHLDGMATALQTAAAEGQDIHAAQEVFRTLACDVLGLKLAQ